MRDTVSLPDRPPALAGFDRQNLAEVLAGLGYERFRAHQVFRWIHRHGVTDVEKMTDLPRDLRATLTSAFSMPVVEVESRSRSSDGTEKFLLRLSDGFHIESVFIPDTPGRTFCISTQVGCAMACAFCLTGRMGLSRNLRADEIVAQVQILVAALDLRATPFNVVLMGMGEPLHNYDETMTALRILADEHGLAVPPRRMTLSTIGLPAAIERLAHEPVMPNLAISLHATTDSLRGELVPVGRKHLIADVIKACRVLPLKRRSRITFEYVLLAGVNDSAEQARQLARLLGPVKSKVNLIPLNAAAGIPFERPSDEVIDRFARTVAEGGLTVSVRKSRGRDIRAACGQLIVEGRRLSPGKQLAELTSPS